MADSPDGIRTWPTTPEALADIHKCPGCFTQVSVAVCPVCGFVLTDPRAMAVLALGRRILSSETERQRVIEEVRLAYRSAPEVTLEPAPAPVVTVASTPAPAVTVAPPTALPDEHAAAERALADPAHVPSPWPVAEPAPSTAVEPVPQPNPEIVPEADLVPAGILLPASEEPASVTPRRPAPEPRAPRRRLSVPVLLLIVGVSLVGVAAIFFMVYAWFTWGIAVRALIIGAITVATIAIASLLRRRALTATAEGIAVLGVVLLALDAWAVRANDFFGTGQVQEALYAGISILAIGVLCRVWAKLSKLRSPDIAAVLALPAGLGLVVGGASSLPTGEAIAIGLLGAAFGGLAHALPAPWSSARARADAVPERVTLAVIGVAALVAATFVAAFASLESIAVPLWSGAAIIVLGVAHTYLLRRRGEEERLPAAAVLAATASGTAAAVAASLGWQLAYRADLPVYTLLIGPVLAVAVPALLDRSHARVSGLGAARITATAVGVISLVVTVALWTVLAGLTISTSWVAWQTDVFTAPADQAEGALFAATAGLLIAALLFVAPTLGRPVLRNARIIAATVLVLVGVAVVAVPSLLVGMAILVAVVAVLAITRPALRPGASAAAGLAAATAFVAGTAAPWLWLFGVIVAVAVPIVAQVIVRPAGAAAGWLTLAPVGVATISAFLAPAALGAAVGAPPDSAVAFVLVQWVSLLSVLGAVVLTCAPASRITLAVSGYTLFLLSLAPYAIAAVGLTATATTPPAMLGEPALAVVRAVALLVLVALIALGRTRVARIPSLGAAVIVAPVASTATFAVVQVLGLEQDDARALATVGAAVTVVWVAAVWSMLRSHPALATEPTTSAPEVVAVGQPDAVTAPASAPTSAPAAPALSGATTRAMVDLGALATVFVLAWDVPVDLRWAMLAVVALGFAGASVSRGWAAPAGAHTAGVPSTRALGVPTARVPRRLLAWPAFAFATAALWFGLWTAPGADSLTVEAYAIPPAVGLLAFAGLLIWLRRHGESAVAVTASFLLGLAVPALAGWSGSSLRGTVIAVVSAALCLLLTCTPALRARIPALAGATTALLALALVTVERAVDDPLDQVAWLLLLVAVSYVAAVGAARALKGTGRPGLWAIIIPPSAVAIATGAGILSADRTPVLTTALVVLAGLHVAAAAIGRAPFGAATRWTTIGAAAAFAAVGFLAGAATIDGVAVVELVSLPIALAVLAGSALAQWRRHRLGLEGPDAERAVWLVGLALTVLPSIVAPIEPLRVWLAVVVPLVAALVAVLVPLGALRALRIPSAVVLTVGAFVMGARTLAQPTFASAESAVLAAGAGTILVAVAMIWTAASRPDATGTTTGMGGASTPIAGAGAALLVAAVIVLSDGELASTTLTAITAAAVGVGGAALLGLERWRGLGAVLALAGFLGALVAVGARLTVIVDTAGPSIEPDLWAAIALAITAAIGIMAVRATTGTPVARTVAIAVGVAFAAALVFYAVAEFLLLGDTAGDEVRTVVTMTALTVAGFLGVLWRSRLGLTPPITAAAASVAFGLSALILYSVTPVELVTVPPALGLVALGARALRRNPQARTWATLGPGLALLTAPSLLHDFGETELWRVVALGLLALALVIIGAVRRLQAPLVIGSVVLLTHGIAQLWPWISSAYVYVPWWLWLGIGGAVLIYLAARYERSMRALRTSFTAVASLR